jgi:sulfur carrier protein ThiS
MSRAAAEVVATEQTAAATEETAEEVIDEVLATAGAEVADLLASKGVTISPAILTLGADVVLQQYSPLSIDGLPDFSQYLFIFLLNA